MAAIVFHIMKAYLNFIDTYTRISVKILFLVVLEVLNFNFVVIDRHLDSWFAFMKFSRECFCLQSNAL